MIQIGDRVKFSFATLHENSSQHDWRQSYITGEVVDILDGGRIIVIRTDDADEDEIYHSEDDIDGAAIAAISRKFVQKI